MVDSSGAELPELPTRFESILVRPDLEPGPLILPVDADLRAFERLGLMARTQGAGVLGFLLGRSGVGKTTAVYSASIHLSDSFARVLAVPAELDLRDVAAWLSANVPRPGKKTIPLLFDGREFTDDIVGLGQLMSALNQLLRTRRDLIALWPTTDPQWHAQLRTVAERIGGTTLAPRDSDLTIVGPPRAMWTSAFERLLMQMDLTLNDLGLDRDVIEGLASVDANSKEDENREEAPRTLGDFLRAIAAVLVARVEHVKTSQVLPAIVFVITSTSEVVGEANRIRRAGTLLLKPEELLTYSPRSRPGLWWKDRNADPRYHLGYIITLFNARLATMTPSSVVYAVAEFDPSLRRRVEDAGVVRNASNARRTLETTDFYRLMTGSPPTELTSTRKGRTAQATIDAYMAIQRASAKRHLAINRAICRLMAVNVPSFDLENAAFEVDQGRGEVFTDVVVPTDSGDEYLEFHHTAYPRAASMASYIMWKLQYYAIRFNLAPR